jgi:protein-tyrosine phosphatase
MRAFFVTKRLAFGSAITTWGHVEKLQALGVTHVINLRHGKHGKIIRKFKNLWLPFRDDMQSRPRWFYRRALRFYKRAMRKPNAKVFVMCHHGVCRSASLTYFLLCASGFTHSRAQNVVLRARPRAFIARAYREGGEIFLALEWAKRKQARG